ncbi:MAG TPA: hypothetical protein VJQ54_23270 [Candidatus Sulfotelmatobacter sp.]|nr:hypothetical protein [Candidatus Sulfotelmatobacter sp.]
MSSAPDDLIRSRRVLRDACTWALFFLIAAGLGYATLNRYDPRVAVPDAAIYARIATNGPGAVQTALRFRILVPYLARMVSAVARNHTGSWDPLIFSFLFVNACFVATTAYLIFGVALRLVEQPSIALLASALYLLNFAVANVQLAALVDSAEACFLMALVVAIIRERWFLLPLVGIVGTLSKESFVPFSIVMAVAWWLAAARKNSRPAFWIALTALTEVATLVVLQSTISGRLALPWTFVSSMSSPTSYMSNLWHSLADRNSWYILIWLLPLGLAGLKPMPREWKASAGTGVAAAIILNAYHSTVGGGGGGLGRYVFNVAGPLLSLSAAAFLARWLSTSERPKSIAGI